MSVIQRGGEVVRPLYKHAPLLAVAGVAVSPDVTGLIADRQRAREVLFQNVSAFDVVLRLDGVDATADGPGELLRAGADASFPCDPAETSLILAAGEAGPASVRVSLAVA